MNEPMGDPPTGEPEEDDLDTTEEPLEDWSGPDLGAVLRAALETPGDPTTNARSRVDQKLKGRSVTSTVTDIAGSGVATVWHLLTGPPDPADENTTKDRFEQ